MLPPFRPSSLISCLDELCSPPLLLSSEVNS